MQKLAKPVKGIWFFALVPLAFLR